MGEFWPSKGVGSPPEEKQWEQHLQQTWGTWFRNHNFKKIPTKSYAIAYNRFIQGYCKMANMRIKPEFLLPASKTVTCVITAMNEEHFLQAQLDELQKGPFNEIIVIVNGSTDRSFDVARQHPVQATVIHFDFALGYDVGRAVGAKLANSDVVLFLDSDMCISSKLLMPFIYEVEKGADVVLNPISSLLPVFSKQDAVSQLKQFLNISLGRNDLQADSMTAVPHALSRRAIKTLGVGVLAVPPLAQARALHVGLKVVQSPKVVDVIKRNRLREHNICSGNQVENLIVGDHVEALYDVIQERGPRLLFEDRLRKTQHAD